MVFSFIDQVSEVKNSQSITAFFTLRGNEEFLLDHFEGFPVMPGVLLLEALRQAASELMRASGMANSSRRLTHVHNVKFGQFVRPGQRIRLAVKWLECRKDRVEFEGQIHLMNADEAAGPRALQAAFSLAA